MTEAWTLTPGNGIGTLQRVNRNIGPVGPDQVQVAVKAVSLNSRDLMVANGMSPMPTADVLTPCSDAAGVVTAVGENVVHLNTGDRVVMPFNPAHMDGPFKPEYAPHAFGEMAQGVLAREVVVHSSAPVALPDTISFDQAACLPCAAVVAWNAMFETGRLFPGQTVFATGTGAVSLVAMALAKAAGMKFGLSSSDTGKLDAAKDLGADFGVNYRETQEWAGIVREATKGGGANVVLENAGPPSVAMSVKAAAQGGRVVQIGWKGFDGPPLSVLEMALGGVSVVPVMVGSRAILERVVAAVAVNQIKFQIGMTVDFAEANAAFEAHQNGDAFGKIVVVSQ